MEVEVIFEGRNPALPFLGWYEVSQLDGGLVEIRLSRHDFGEPVRLLDYFFRKMPKDPLLYAMVVSRQNLQTSSIDPASAPEPSDTLRVRGRRGSQ